MWCSGDMTSRSHFEILLLRMCTFSIFISNVASCTSPHRNANKQQTHQMWWLKAVTGSCYRYHAISFVLLTNLLYNQPLLHPQPLENFEWRNWGWRLWKVSLLLSQWFRKHAMIGLMNFTSKSRILSVTSEWRRRSIFLARFKIKSSFSWEFFVFATSKISSNSMDPLFRFFFGAVGMVAASVIPIALTVLVEQFSFVESW